MVAKKNQFIIPILFLIAGIGPFFSYLTYGVSFYTFHAIAGLLAIKHQIALCFLSWEYPLWNPMMLCGVPFHSGIGILDPLLVTYLFMKGIPALMASSYLALFVAGFSMYLYLKSIWKMSDSAAILGGILYLANPFFGATCHELPFMAPPVYLPLIFLFFEKGIESRAIGSILISGFFVSLSFLSGNLESFYFIALFLIVLQCSRALIQSIDSQSMEPIKTVLGYLLLTLSAALCISAIDLLPSIGMIFDSGRDANASMFQNGMNMVLIGGAAVLWRITENRVCHSECESRKFIKLIISVLIFILFAVNFRWHEKIMDLNTNIFFPLIDKLMIRGQESFSLLLMASGVTGDLLKAYFEPRFIFYIQPPLYLFSMVSLVIFSLVFGFGRDANIRHLAVMSLLWVVFPYTSVPNLNHYLFHLDQIAYPRIMFAFFFMQAIIVGFGFERITQNHLWRMPRAISGAGIIISLLGVFIAVKVGFQPFNARLFQDLLSLFAENQENATNSWLRLSRAYGDLTNLALGFFCRKSILVFFAAVLKYLTLLFFCCTAISPRKIWRYGFVLFMSIEVLLAWNIYCFQKHDSNYVTGRFKETEFLKTLGTQERVGTVFDEMITLKNFYNEDRDFLLQSNMPMFWNVKTIEGSALNLSPRLFSEFWKLEPRNTYTPTTIETVPSKIYNLMGLNYLFSRAKVDAPSYQKVVEGDYYQVYKNSKALPRFYFAQSVRPADVQAVKEKIGDISWDPVVETIIEGTSPELFTRGERGTIQVDKDGYNQIVLKCDVPSPQFLATTNAYHRNWKVYVDGVPKSLVKTNYYFQGVFLEQGTHEVRFVYLPFSFQLGIWVTVISIMVLLFFGIRDGLHRFRSI